MAVKEIYYSTNARQRLLKGVEELAGAVKVTLGPRGRNVIIQKAYGSPVVTKDGVTVAKEIALQDKIANMGAQMVKEVASKTADDAGDGTTTATVLAEAIVIEGHKAVAAGMNPMDLKRGMDKATAEVVKELKKLSTPCRETKAIAQVGTISANSDESIGKLIAEAMEKVGKDGIITVDESSGFNDELKVVEGMQFDRGYISPYFVNNQKNMSSELEAPFILVIDKKIAAVQEILPILEKVIKANRSLLVIAEDVDGEALATLVVNTMRSVIKACAVRAPGFGDNRKELLKDIAVLTGATVISDEIGFTLENAQLIDLGVAKRIVITKENTTIIGGNGKPENIQDRLNDLQQQVKKAESAHERKVLQERIAKISGGVAVIKVGASSEVEMKEKKDRVEDALHAIRAAVEEGVVPGGGVALVRCISPLKDLKGDNDDQNHGIAIIVKALEAPLRQIVANAGAEPAVVIEKVKNAKDNFGYNAATDEYGDMARFGILDPTKVTRTAIQQAVSVAGLLITTECTISEIEEKEDQNNQFNNMMRINHH